ncbi:hypothetical protein ACFYO2_26740 [Streptomyces sp. NPDC006602]|uniref:hypothetical protein n=1 Tax=Streptomyces sp. NPDC006602 TaxID=3364751 RepID=UPI00369CBB1A
MAEAVSTTVEKLVTEKKKVTAFNLTLSAEEAEALMALVGNISGDSNSPRMHTDSVYYALSNAGVSVRDKDVSKQMTGNLRWLSQPKAPSYRF